MLQQQGDVILKPVTALPKNAVKQQPKERDFVLAEGEATGHAHVFAQDSSVELWQDGEDLYLNVSNDIVEQAQALLHEEHKIQPLRKGVYKVEKIQEYDYDIQAAKKIAD